MVRKRKQEKEKEAQVIRSQRDLGMIFFSCKFFELGRFIRRKWIGMEAKRRGNGIQALLSRDGVWWLLSLYDFERAATGGTLRNRLSVH